MTRLFLLHSCPTLDVFDVHCAVCEKMVHRPFCCVCFVWTNPSHTLPSLLIVFPRKKEKKERKKNGHYYLVKLFLK
ncbi:Uncharacterized protein APZ42_032913 [Daphnia magna]|uniref:Uncharacterized protein n=1 Tax=Daphnia magna TaxID=35525 RepID=A0A164LZM5_9CRUS|nr:Uncharacterized protein APZ42_032913 [Daphnia magna]